LAAKIEAILHAFFLLTTKCQTPLMTGTAMVDFRFFIAYTVRRGQTAGERSFADRRLYCCGDPASGRADCAVPQSPGYDFGFGAVGAAGVDGVAEGTSMRMC